jgi:(p)ppGpp synthase/HD superfamily hydrolase
MYSYRIEQALRAITILHKDQVRKGAMPIPYISHLFAVALIVSEYTKDEDTLIGALLHDTLEDTDYTGDELQQDFGGKVREIVESLSEPHGEEHKGMPWKDRKIAYARTLRKASEEALIIAAADKIHNMRAIVEEYYDDHSRFLADFEGSLEDRVLMYEEVSTTLNKGLTNTIIKEFNHVFLEYKNFITDVKNAKDKAERF